MPIRLFHGREHVRNVFPWHFFVKEIAHGISEDHSRSFPLERLKQSFGAQS